MNMKKTILSMLLIGSSAMLFAQTDTTNRNNTNNTTTTNTNTTTTTSDQMKTDMNTNTMNNNMESGMNTTTGNYNAYGNTAVNVPARFQTSFTTQYPTASNVMWSQVGDFYRASYNTNGRFTHVYYGNNGTSWTVALPKLHSYVPEELVSRVGSMYGPTVYSIGQIRTANGEPAYQVTLVENGQSRMEWLREDGTSIQNVDVYRTEEATMTTETNMNSNMNTNTSTDANLNSANTTTTTENTQTTTTENTSQNTTTTGQNLNNSTNNNNNNQNNLNTTSENPAMAPTKEKEKETKVKMKTSDGKEIKIKTEKDKVKIKRDDD
jgi:hypothetical protein